MDTIESPQRASATVTATRWLAVGSLLGLIALGLAWELWLAPLRPGGTWLALKVLPLCLPLAGILRNRMYTYRWVSLLGMDAISPRAWCARYSDRGLSAQLALAEIALCLALFAACALHVRHRHSKARHESTH